MIVLILSILGGGFIGVLIALLRNMMRSGVNDSTQIEKDLDLPVYATVPRSPIQETRMSILKRKRVSLSWRLKVAMTLQLKVYVVFVQPFTSL